MSLKQQKKSCIVCCVLPTLKSMMTATLVRGVARGGPAPPQNLADQLTLFKPWGADYARHTTASPPRIQNAIYTSGAPL